MSLFSMGNKQQAANNTFMHTDMSYINYMQYFI